jgi:hypothetical protein
MAAPDVEILWNKMVQPSIPLQFHYAIKFREGTI